LHDSKDDSPLASSPASKPARKPQASAKPPTRPRRRKPSGKRRGAGPITGTIGWFALIVATPLALPFNALLFGLIGAAVLLNAIQEDLPEVDALLEVKFEEPLAYLQCRRLPDGRVWRAAPARRRLRGHPAQSGQRLHLGGGRPLLRTQGHRSSSALRRAAYAVVAGR
jgi:hypothetical protein